MISMTIPEGDLKFLREVCYYLVLALVYSCDVARRDTIAGINIDRAV